MERFLNKNLDFKYFPSLTQQIQNRKYIYNIGK